MITLDDGTIKVLDRLGERIANAIGGTGAPGHDATGGCVDSLTEAVMGTTAGLVQIANAISDLAEAIRERA